MSTISELRRRILELESQLVYRLPEAYKGIASASIERNVGSGIILRLEWLGGGPVIQPTMIRDGLSRETIAALQQDLKRSWQLAILNKPAGW